MKLHGKHLLGFTARAQGRETFCAVNPQTNALLEPPFSEAGEEEIDRAMEMATHAFAHYRKTTGRQRAVFLEAIADGMMGLGDALLDRFTAETALPRGRAEGERARTVGQLRMFADLAGAGSWIEARIDTALPDRTPLPKPDLRRMLIPVGPVVVFSASNFPLAFSVAGGDTASALAAGCPVVVKAHEAHPGVSELVGRVIQDAAAATDMPEGVFSMLQGRSHAIGVALVTHRHTQAAGFTGSLRGGRALCDAAASRPHPIQIYAEMGSTNPVLILPDAAEKNDDHIAKGLIQSLTMGVGQFCTRPGLVIGIQSAGFRRLINQTVALIEDVVPATMLHRELCDAFCQGIEQMRSLGAQVVGQASRAENSAQTEARPTLLRTDGARFLEHAPLKEEVFGPSTLFVVVRDREELEQVVGSLDGQLTATLHSTREELHGYDRLIALLEQRAGRLILNSFPTGVEVCSSMHHGGPYPASSDVRSTSVGSAAIHRFARPICYQGFPQEALPRPLRNQNEANLWRMVNGDMTQMDIEPGRGEAP